MKPIDHGQRVFHKSIGLLEERMGLKVKKAMLLIETDFGDFQFMLRDDMGTFQMILSYFTQKMNKFMYEQIGSQLVRCTRCQGSGMVWTGDTSSISIVCPKCQGGGQMILTAELETLKETTQNGGV